MWGACGDMRHSYCNFKWILLEKGPWGQGGTTHPTINGSLFWVLSLHSITLGPGGLWTAVLSKTNSGRAVTKAAIAGMPPFSATVIPEHTAVGAHQPLGQRWAFLPFGKCVGSRDSAAEGIDCQGDNTLLPPLYWEKIKGCADEVKRMEGGDHRQEGGRVAEEINGGGEVQEPLR